jgi:hypothetical protein
MDLGTIKLLVSMALFSLPVIWCSENLPKRGLFGRPVNRPVAQAVGAVIGLTLGVGFLLAVG